MRLAFAYRSQCGHFVLDGGMAAGNFCRYVLVLVGGFIGGRRSQWFGAHDSLQIALPYILAYLGRVDFFDEFADAGGAA